MSRKLIKFINYVNVIQSNGSVLKNYDSIDFYFIINTIHYGFFIKNDFDSFFSNHSIFYYYEHSFNEFSYLNDFYSYTFSKKNKKKHFFLHLKNSNECLKKKYFTHFFIFKKWMKYDNFFLLNIIHRFNKHIIYSIFFNI